MSSKKIKGIWYPGTEVFVTSNYLGDPTGVGWVEKKIDPRLDSHVIVHSKNDKGERDWHCYFITEVHKLNKKNWIKQFLKMWRMHEFNNTQKKEIPVQIHARVEGSIETPKE